MSEVRRRCVFYISGFDPKGASHYHALYKEQAALQAKVNGLHIDVGPRRKLESGNSAWTLKAVDDGIAVETSYEFMRWDDIVRAHWPRDQWQLWGDIIATSWFNVRCGALSKVWELSQPAGLALTLPIALMLAALLGVPIISALAGALVYTVSTATMPTLLACGATAALLIAVARRIEARFSMYWMMRSYGFTRLQALGRAQGLEERLEAMADRLVQRLAENKDDEVLVVGHSSGPIMACSVVARALRRMPPAGPAAGPHPVLSLLTLGQCIPILGLLPQAGPFRQELAELARNPQLAWIDFSAPPDGCCFALSDPVAGCGVQEPRQLVDHPKLLSPRFAQMFDEGYYHELKRDKFRMHFQYLMAAHKPAEYDYFRITAGARTLAQRFAHLESVTNYRRK
jgi:hypothetical protein